MDREELHPADPGGDPRGAGGAAAGAIPGGAGVVRGGGGDTGGGKKYTGGRQRAGDRSGGEKERPRGGGDPLGADSSATPPDRARQADRLCVPAAAAAPDGNLRRRGE